MGKVKSFEEFLKSQTESKSETPVDWERRKDLWLNSIKQLYRQVRDWLRTYKDDGYPIEILEEVPDIYIEEKLLGAYKAERLNFKVGRHQFQFQPVGTVIVGAQGRVDIYGPYGKRLLIKPELGEEKRKWYVVDPNNRSGNQLPFSEETFQKIIVELGTPAIKEEENDEY
ncbi:MAG: hypothetical protein ACOCZ8_00715 [Bacteroidota bacterium]